MQQLPKSVHTMLILHVYRCVQHNNGMHGVAPHSTEFGFAQISSPKPASLQVVCIIWR